MIELFSSGLVSLWLKMAGVKPSQVDANQLLVWQGVPLVVLPKATEADVEKTIGQYLKNLSAKGMVAANQGIWIQSGPTLLVNHQGTIPVPAASITKIATTLAALETWGPAYRFETRVGATGPIKNGVLQGDLIINGSSDPFFVWEEAIALGNSLNKLGIRKVTGSLVIAGNFYMNYQSNPTLAGQLLSSAFDSARWSRSINFQYFNMPKGTPKPQILIGGGVKIASLGVPKQLLLLRHQSVSLIQILKEMNIYSNNDMSEMLAKSIGGASIVAQQAAQKAGVPQSEIQLINGSGLTTKNKISPRAASLMLMAIQRYLRPYSLNLADIFPVSGLDNRGTLNFRKIPVGTIIKTGTLNEVSALAGVMPTRDRGLIWFAIINGGRGVDYFRTQQDQLLQKLVQKWGTLPQMPIVITPRNQLANAHRMLGQASRNQVISGVQANLPLIPGR